VSYGHFVRTPQTDCPGTGRRTLTLSIESVRPAVRPPDKKEIQAEGSVKQQHFNFLQEPQTRLAKLRGYDVANLRCAEIILSERPRYERESRLLVLWAERVMTRLAPERTERVA